MEIKNQSGDIIEFKEVTKDGIPVAIVKGYIATWDIDTWSDQFVKGCFEESLNELRTKNKGIPLKAEHNNVIGIFPIETLREDHRGLYGEAEINLEVQEGREFYSLGRQKAISSFSIGFSTQEKEMFQGIRKILKSKVFEGSMVGNPMNESADITEVKTRDMLPQVFADKKHLFTPSDIDGVAYLFEKSLQVADVIDGELVIIPRAVINARFQMIKGLDGMTDQEKQNSRDTINSLYKDMGYNEPFEDGNSKPLNKTEIKSVKKSTLIDILRNSFSADASEHISHLITSSEFEERKSNDSGEILNNLLQQLKTTKENII